MPNLFASVLYGSESIRPGCGRYTAAGIALDFAVYGFMGCAFGFAWRDQRGGARLLWVGMLVALITWYVVFRVIWKNASPVGALYAPDRQLFIGNLIYGFMLGRFPKAASRLSAFPRLS